MMFDRPRRWLDSFVDTIRAGYYAPVLPHKQHSAASTLPRKPWVLAAYGALGLAGSLATDAIVTLAVGASVIGIAAGAGFAVVAGGAIMGALYVRSLRHSRETLGETNMAGQQVQGTRADLYTLHQAQRKIIGLTEAFDEIAAPSVIEADVQDVIAATAPVRARVRVLDAGSSGDKKEYEFVRPVVQFANAARPVIPPRARAPRRHAAPVKVAAISA